MTEVSSKKIQSPLPYSSLARNCVIALYVLAAVWGVVEIAFPDNSRLYFLFAILFAVSATLWARFDAFSRSKPILPILQMLYFLFWPVGAAIYLIARSGWRGLGIGLLHGAGLYLTLTLASFMTFYSLHFAGLLDPRFYQQP